MSDLLTGLKSVAIRMLTSLKVWTTVFGIFATWLAARGIIIDPALAQYVAGFFGLLLLGQAAQDHGKEAAIITAQSNVDMQQNGASLQKVLHAATAEMIAEPTKIKLMSVHDDGQVLMHTTDGGVHDVTNILKEAGFVQGVPLTPGVAGITTASPGFANVALMSLLATIAFTALLLFSGCNTVAECKEPANVHTTKCTVVNAVLDCTKGELPAVINALEPLALKLIAEATGADGSVDWNQVPLGSLAADEGTCLLANILMKRPKMTYKQGEVGPAMNDLRAKFNDVKKTYGIDASVVVHTAQGDI